MFLYLVWELCASDDTNGTLAALLRRRSGAGWRGLDSLVVCLGDGVGTLWILKKSLYFVSTR